MRRNVKEILRTLDMPSLPQPSMAFKLKIYIYTKIRQHIRIGGDFLQHIEFPWGIIRYGIPGRKHPGYVVKFVKYLSTKETTYSCESGSEKSQELLTLTASWSFPFKMIRV